MRSMWKESQLREFSKRGINVSKPLTKAKALADEISSPKPKKDEISSPTPPVEYSEKYIESLGNVSLPDMLAAFEIRILKYALKKSDGNQSGAADLLGISRTTLRSKMKKHNIS